MNEAIEPNNEAVAWEEVKSWYANCITAAPKPNADAEGVNIGHVIRWCLAWDISTADIKTICDKHGVDIEQFFIRPL